MSDMSKIRCTVCASAFKVIHDGGVMPAGLFDGCVKTAIAEPVAHIRHDLTLCKFHADKPFGSASSILTFA